MCYVYQKHLVIACEAGSGPPVAGVLAIKQMGIDDMTYTWSLVIMIGIGDYTTPGYWGLTSSMEGNVSPSHCYHPKSKKGLGTLLPPQVKARACYCTVAWTWSKISGPGTASFGTYIQHPIDWGDKFLTPRFWRRSQEGFWSCGFVWNLWDPFKFDGWENTLSLLKWASITI